MDGQQASAEVEVTEDAAVTNGHGDGDGDNLITNGTGSPVNGGTASPASVKSGSTTSSKPSSAVSQKEESKKTEEDKPASAVSRSSIPDAIVYEPPERRKSAASVASDAKKDPEADKSQLDEKESEKGGKDEKKSAESKDNYIHT